ncbi:hypothetical protein BGZ68_004646, partial [Mortierella alpina]
EEPDEDMKESTDEETDDVTEEEQNKSADEEQDKDTMEADEDVDEETDEEQETSRANNEPASPERPPRPTIPTLDCPTAEDRPANIDLNQLAGENVVLAFGGTDYGLAIMSRTIAQTRDEVERRIARF